MTTPVSNINRANLNALDPNLATGQVADPALRKACFDEVYNYFDTFVAAHNAFVANGGIVTANIGDLAVTMAKLALGAVSTAQIASAAVGSGQLADGAVTSVKIADDTIVNADINSSAAISWSKVSKTLSSLADLATRSATDLNSGTLNVARLPTTIPATNIGNGDVSNAILSFLNTLTSNAQTQLDAKVPLSQKGVANGVATLDSGIKIPITQLPDAILGALIYQGTYNATTNTPALPSAVGNKGWFYIISAAGTVSGTIYDVGDWIVSNGTVWQKVDNTDAVSSFNSRLGAIVPTAGDYDWSQITKTISSLADLTTRSASDLSSGTLPDARRGARTGDVTSPSGSGVNTIAANAVTTAKIADLNVTTVKLADANVTTGKLADLAVTTAKINDLGITTGKVADGAITSAKLDPSINVAGIPLATHIAANPIDHPDGSVTNVKIATGAITKDKTVSSSLQRSSTLTVAASNSTAAGLATADYVCTGTNDHTTINTALAALPIVTWESGTATAGGSTTITLAANRSGKSENWYVGYTIAITGGTGSGQTKLVTGFAASTGIVTVDSAWTTTPDATSTYDLKSKCGKVILLEGVFSIASYVSVPTGCTLEGQGDGTVLKIPNGNNTSLNVITGNNFIAAKGDSHITVKNLRIEGNKANNTSGTQLGIGFSRVSYCTISNCTVNDMRNTGIETKNQTVITYGCKILDNTVMGCATGISFNGSNHIIRGNNVSYNSSAGISFSTGSYNDICDNISSNNSGSGINITSMTYSVVSSNICSANTLSGIALTATSDNNTISNNNFQGNGQYGISLSASSNNTIASNTCLENSQTTTATYDNIFIDTTSNTNNVQGNTCRQGALTNKPRYGIRINASTCTGNFVTNNDLTTSGTTGILSDVGTGTVTTAGNKLA